MDFKDCIFIDFSKGTVCNNRLLFLSVSPHTSVHTSMERRQKDHVKGNEN